MADNYEPVDGSRVPKDNPGRYDAVNRYGDEYSPVNDASTTPPWNDPGLGIFYRTGYKEVDLVDYDTRNLKANAALHFRLRPEQAEQSPELILASSFGNGTTVYQGDNRFSLKGILFFQNRIELRKRDKWFIRAYATHEDAGKSYDPYFTALLLQERAKPDERWGQNYRRFWKQFIVPKIEEYGYPQLTWDGTQFTFDYEAAEQWLAAYHDSLVVWHSQAEYFANATLSGDPVLVRQDAAIDFDWWLGAPDPALPDDYFSVRWRATLNFPAGLYRFTTQTDDGVRLLVDGRAVIESWHPMRGYRAALVDLTAGPHTIVMEYFERTEAALARLRWTRIGPPVAAASAPSGAPGPWQAEYFANPSLEGAPRLTRTDERLDFNWGFGSPDPALPSDDFSVRWTTRQRFPAGRYTFTTYSDDGVRLYVDGQRVLDSWRPMRGYRSVTLDLDAGEHTIVLEYFEQKGIALVRLSWHR